MPRIDLAALAARKPEDAKANFGKQPKVKPPAKPFNPDEVGQLRVLQAGLLACFGSALCKPCHECQLPLPAHLSFTACRSDLSLTTTSHNTLRSMCHHFAGQGAPAGGAPAARPCHRRRVLHPQRQPALPGGVRAAEQSGGRVDWLVVPGQRCFL